MNVINPFISPSSGLTFHLSSNPEVILSNMLLIKEINKAAEDLFEVKKREVIEKSFLEICKDRNLFASIEQQLSFILSGHIYEPRERLIIANKEGKAKYKFECHPMRTSRASMGLFDLIAIVCTQIPDYKMDNLEMASDNLNLASTFTSLPTDKLVVKSHSTLNITLEEAFNMAPCSLCWMNRNHIYLGCNLEACRAANINSPKEFIGKNAFDIVKMQNWPESKAQEIYDVDERIMHTGIAEFDIQDIMPQINQEASIHQRSAKKPIFDANGQVIGLMTSGLYFGQANDQFRLKV